MVIRKYQMEAFEDAASRPFENEMLSHLQKFNPHHFKVIGEAGMRQVIRAGRKKAEQFGFTRRGPVRLFLELMIMFGSDFATDPLHSWAGETLAQPAVPQMERASRLYTGAREYISAVAGPEVGYERAAMHRSRALRWEDLKLADDDFASASASRLEMVYPEKVRHVSANALRRLIARAGQMSQAYGVASVQGRMLFVGMAFTLGHGFTSDPLYPWVSGTLDNTAVDAERRAERLFSKAQIYLTAVEAHLAPGRP